MKRKADDDLIYTISDNEDIPDEDAELPAEPKPAKKKKTKKGGKGSKKGAAAAQDDGQGDDDDAEAVWTEKGEDDGTFDPDFEFAPDTAAGFGVGDLEEWGFDGAKKGAFAPAQKEVDLDEIIRRRLEKLEKKKKKQQQQGKSADAEEEDEAEAEDAEDPDADLDLDDMDDEVLAEDGFGMGVPAEDDDDDDEKDDGGEGEPDGSDVDEDNSGAEDDDDDESVASQVGHPDDEGSDSDASDEEDAEEAAKREAFFAPEDKTQQQQQAGGKQGKSTFQHMHLSRPILMGLTSVGFNNPTPIQAKTIPIALEGKDVVGGAVTGSGKTAAFVVPILERLLYRPKKVAASRVVIMAPTRELAMQCHAVATRLASRTDIKFCLAVGGLSLKAQEAELRLRPDVIIATPGRFIDHMRNTASFNVDTVEILVLDEADRMLEDGFADELNEILTTLPKSRQTMLFSATMTSSVDQLIRVGLNRPVRLLVDAKKKTVDKLEQQFVRLRPNRVEKRMGYLVHICQTMRTERVIIFFRQKKDAHLARVIFGIFGLSCAELHGSMKQLQRITSVEDFRDGRVSFLLATDVASRGLDIKGVDTVINYEVPQSLEIYIHRIGRTARAGRSGVAVTLAAENDRKIVKAAAKAGKAQGAKITGLAIEPEEPDRIQARIDAMEDDIKAIMREEAEERQMAQAEMQIKKGENMVVHEDEIKARPKRTWFETQDDKQKARDAGRAALNGKEALKEKLKGKNSGKLSGKDKKKLDSKTDRTDGRAWKKGSAERAGKGAVLNFKSDKSKSKKGGPPKGKRR